MLKPHLCSFILVLSLVALAAAGADADQFANLQREPDTVTVITEAGAHVLSPQRDGRWTIDSLQVQFHVRKGKLGVQLTAPDDDVKRVAIHWTASLPTDWKYLGDAWERAYGDLEWKPLEARRVLPWYFLASNGQYTHGYGVMTGPGALCYWTAEAQGITLHADVRCGGMGVELGARTLEVCTVVSRRGEDGETPFMAAQKFCGLMCPRPVLPKKPVYGFNDWYCTYGHDTADQFLADVVMVSSFSPDRSNRPFAVVDDGWQWNGDRDQSPGLWDRTRPAFSKTLSMTDLAGRIRAAGARPGLWYRPLIANVDAPAYWRLQRDANLLDPTVPAVRDGIRQAVSRFHGWGYELIKHDYTTFDICGRWGPKMGAEVTPDGWAFADRTQTTAEVIRTLYRDIRQAAGAKTLIIGCNTMGHLAAGLFELQRVGDDTSGNDWNRTRDMGVNCLGFRAPQNGTFFQADADCAGQTAAGSVPWEKNSQWLDLLAHSGTALFVSFPRELVKADQEHALRAALTAAAQPQPTAEPLDWLTRRAPEQWRLDGQEQHFKW